MILHALHLIQSEHGYLPAEALREFSARTNTPLHRLHEVASYYPHFRLRPASAVEVKVCRDLSCHLRGGPALHNQLSAAAAEFGDRVTVGGVSCLGQCDRPPAATVNDQVYRGLSAEQLLAHVRTAIQGQPLPPQREEYLPGTWQIDPYQGHVAYSVVEQVLAGTRDTESILRELETADLRGMGGAGFRTHLKWAAVRGQPADIKYIICNADESEPGTFKDRELLRRLPHLVLEGVILGGLVTGAARGWIYIRHEYQEEIQILRQALREAETRGYCGANLLGTGRAFPVELFISPGGYIQGEETALLEAMEDRRGEPRNKPPYPVTHGLFGKPTVINNVETLAWVPAIVLRGGTWYRARGHHGATGLRFVSVSGDVERPGVYEVPFGQTVRELLHAAGGLRDGQQLQAIAPSGPSSGFLPAKIRRELLPVPFVEHMTRLEMLRPDAAEFDILDLPLDLTSVGHLGSMLGAAFVVIGDHANLLEVARNCTAFFRNESCGKCVPCRLGSQRLTEILTAWTADGPRPGDVEEVRDVAEAMSITSLCGLGMVAGNPIQSLLRFFPDAV